MKPDRRAFLTGAAGAIAAAAPTVSRAEPDWDGYPRLMQGPRVGWTDAETITVWARLSGPYQASLEYAAAPYLRNSRTSQPVRASGDRDFAVVLRADGLTPAQPVYYRVLIDGAPSSVNGGRIWRAQTAPAFEFAGRLRVAFGSCARYAVSPKQPVWDGMAGHEPDLFLWLGDNIYGDSLRAESLREEYRRQLSVPNLEPIQSRASQLAIWDDHDFALNDSDRRNPVRDQALAAFRDYWANPAYGLPDAPGVFFRHAFGPLDLFMLDNRYDRSPAEDPDGPEKTALGFAQRQWLFDELRASRAPFKIIASGQGWTEAKGPGQQSWSAYLYERALILDFIRSNRITGVILLSGDTHVAELNALRGGTDGYDLIECVSSPLAQETAMSWLNYRPVPRLRQVYSGGPNFGLLDFDLSQADPVVRITVHNTQGDAVWAPLDLRASELQPGRSIWRDKMDETSRRRWERFESDGVYYG